MLTDSCLNFISRYTSNIVWFGNLLFIAKGTVDPEGMHLLTVLSAHAKHHTHIDGQHRLILDLDLDSSCQSPRGYHSDKVCMPMGTSQNSSQNNNNKHKTIPT